MARRSSLLAIILGSYLMIVLDISIVITALPRIHHALGFSAAGLSWVQNAYTLSFGGLLLLGARAGDILGRRRMFVVGIALFTLASLAAGAAQSASWLLAARAVQGVGAAIAAPSTLALLMTSFPEGRERTRAMSYYAAVAGGGGSVGLVLGGILTSWLSWRWGLFINVPIGIALVLAAPRVLGETERRSGHFDLAGAATSTLGMVSLVYGIVRAGTAGWGDSFTVASLAAGVVLLAAFVLNERRAVQPITPLHLFASRERVGANVARVLFVGAMFGQFFFLTQYLQGVLGFSPIEAGIAFLPLTLVMFAMTQAVPHLVGRFGNTRVLAGGVLVALAGMAWLSRVGPGTSYWTGIAIPMIVLGIGAASAFAPLTTAGVAGVAAEDAGAASGLVNVAHQLGGSLGLGVLVTVFASSLPANGPAHAISTALTVGTGMLALALAIVLVVVRAPTPVAAEPVAVEADLFVDELAA
jgi:EmrB/QacA subfamily drug resistance transporter